MKNFYHLMIPVLLLLVQGCASVVQKPVTLDTGFWQDRKGVIGVALDPLPSPDTYFNGGAVLDGVINATRAQPLTERLRSIDTKRAAMIAENMAKQLKARGFTVTQLAESGILPASEWQTPATPDVNATRDFRALKAAGIARLLVITVERIGTERDYRGVTPLGPPKAVFKVKGELIDIDSGKVLWMQREDASMPIAEPWDQAPDFPNVVNAVGRNVEEASMRLERSFFGAQNSTAR